MAPQRGMLAALLAVAAAALPAPPRARAGLAGPRMATLDGPEVHDGVQTVMVELDDRSYPIIIGSGLLEGDAVARHVKGTKALVVTNDRVGPLYADTVVESLRRAGKEVHTVTLPDGERFKDMATLGLIIDAAMEHRLDRSSSFVALGGGVVGDMCGFAAAVYQRGVSFVQVPTTLMAMVDSSVGGKTGVNHPRGKNMIGAFHQPDAVVADMAALSTLPPRELRSGLSEVVKYGLIGDVDFLAWQEEHMEGLAAGDAALLRAAVARSCECKAAVVARDERERSSGGGRALLNLGHTFGHAIEAGMGYGAWLHGEAVAAGTAMALDVGVGCGRLDAAERDRAVDLLRRAGLPVTLDNPEAPQGTVGPDAESFLSLMAADKKVSNGQLRLILPRGGRLGDCELTSDFDEAVLRDVVAKYVGGA